MRNASKTITNTTALKTLAAKIGEDRLLDEMEGTGISRWTANEMLKGTYQKSLRKLTQRVLLRGLKKYGVTEEMLFRQVSEHQARVS